MFGRWKKKSSRIAYQNQWLSLREDSVIRPDGNPGIYGVVDLTSSSAIIALTKDNKVYLVKQWRYPLACYTIELPWGGRKKNENFLQCAKRELEEEVGIRAQQWKSLGKVADCPGIVNEFVALYLAQGIQETHRIGISEESDQRVVLVPFARAWRWALDGTIRDAVTITGLTRTKYTLSI